MDLTQLLEDIKPNIVTPNLRTISPLSNEKRAKEVAAIIVRSMVNSIEHPVAKDIYHEGKIHKIRYFDIEPMITGVWPMMSLMLLHLSYGEQASVIEALYPPKFQLTAKAFAATFTNDENIAPVVNVKDDETEFKLESIISGVATIIAMLTKQGLTQPHPDKIKTSVNDMGDMAQAARELELYMTDMLKANQAQHFRDTMRK